MCYQYQTKQSGGKGIRVNNDDDDDDDEHVGSGKA